MITIEKNLEQALGKYTKYCFFCDQTLVLSSSQLVGVVMCNNEKCKHNLRLVKLKSEGDFCAIAFNLFGLTFGFWHKCKPTFHSISKLMVCPLDKIDFSNKEKLIEKCKLYSTFT